jgi:hypothetical protein
MVPLSGHRCTELQVKEGKMSGPFSLRYLHLFLSQKSAGAFILSRNGRSADLVGASPDDLAQAVRQSAQHTGYRYFWYTYTRSAAEARELEKSLYHRYGPADNAPVRHLQDQDWRCTLKGCAACALSARR